MHQGLSVEVRGASVEGQDLAGISAGDGHSQALEGLTVCPALIWAPAPVPALSPHPPVFEVGPISAFLFQMRKLSHHLEVVAVGAGTQHILPSSLRAKACKTDGCCFLGCGQVSPGRVQCPTPSLRSLLSPPPSSVSFSYPHPHPMLSAFSIATPNKCFLLPAPGHATFQRGALGGKVTPGERIFQGLGGVVTCC